MVSPEFDTQTPVISYTRTELLSLKTKISFLAFPLPVAPRTLTLDTMVVVVWWCRAHPVREHAQDFRPPLGARQASPPTRQAAQPPPRGPSTNPRPLV